MLKNNKSLCSKLICSITCFHCFCQICQVSKCEEIGFQGKFGLSGGRLTKPVERTGTGRRRLGFQRTQRKRKLEAEEGPCSRTKLRRTKRSTSCSRRRLKCSQFYLGEIQVRITVWPLYFSH